MAENKPANPCPTCALLSLNPKEPHTKRTARVEELLRRNNPPLDVELADFCLVVDHAPEILQDLDKKIVLAREMLDNLVQARNQAESHLADAKSLIHPMRSLPYEVVSEVFSHCVTTWTMNGKAAKSLDPRTTPWTLTRVCFRWRHIALSLPNLWTYIGLNFEALDEHTSRQLLYKLGLFVERSRGLPLSVYLYSLREINDHPLLPILEVTIPRWKQLSISIPRSSLQSFSGNIFSSLGTLALGFHANDDAESNMDVATFDLTNVPVLRAVQMGLYVAWDSLEHVHLPWSKLVKVIRFPSNDSVACSYLERMTRLEELSMLVRNTGASPRTTPIYLPILLRLTLKERRNPPPEMLQKVFSMLDIPSLFDLNLEFQSSENRLHHFPQLQPSAQERLTKLSISGVTACNTDNIQNLLRFLSDTPCVEHFSIDADITVDFISALKVSSTSPVLPRLRILDISECFCDDALADDSSVIYDMLESRHATSNTSRTVNPALLLEFVRVPRWLYLEKDDRWKEICRDLKVECGITMCDNDTDDEDSASEHADNEG